MLDNSESIAKWEAIDDFSFDFISAEIQFDFPRLYIRLIDGRTNIDQHQDLVFRFDRVAAFSMHEEFVHPTQGTVWGREPIISTKRKSTYPCLIVKGSRWFESLRDELEIHYQGAVHYRLCSNFPVVDIVSPEPPLVSWYQRSPQDQDAKLTLWAPK